MMHSVTMPTSLKAILLSPTCGKCSHYMLVRRIKPKPPFVTSKRTYNNVFQVLARRNCEEGLWGGWRVVSFARFSTEKKRIRVLGGTDLGGSERVADMGFEKKNNKEEDRVEDFQYQSYKLLTLPTILTLGRVAAVPLLICTFYMNGPWATTATTSIFIAAAITDWLDGYIARKMWLGTAFGAFLDPVADKLMVAATLVLLCTRPLEIAGFGQVPWLLTVPSIAIIGREITMSAVREWAASQNSRVLEAVAVNNLGKWKTATQMIALTILLATRDSSLTGPDVLVISGVVLLYVSAGLAVYSLGVYMRKIWRTLLK
ncbi:CDP-diacylglycerol--glycerol-3-phosphate 3-phosphatidyltransferase 2-like [Tasmannia lanceolata]|uniref:CDP-diacylglycerol--glycerol-3-phosphate 3-phosphatidyltransferase 2-like n=1 Tax=Tasmannia lanceolata TaxID=3420 RepID=UPI004064A2B8